MRVRGQENLDKVMALLPPVDEDTGLRICADGSAVVFHRTEGLVAKGYSKVYRVSVSGSQGVPYSYGPRPRNGQGTIISIPLPRCWPRLVGHRGKWSFTTLMGQSGFCRFPARVGCSYPWIPVLALVRLMTVAIWVGAGPRLWRRVSGGSGSPVYRVRPMIVLNVSDEPWGGLF